MNVDAEFAFLSGYALVLVAVSIGFEWLSRRPTSPWASRVLAGSRPPDAPEREDPAPWPHAQVRVFHAGLGLVVLAAALVLTVASAVRNHGPVALTAQGFTLALIGWRLSRLVTSFTTRA